jgi:hypothetical protein
LAAHSSNSDAFIRREAFTISGWATPTPSQNSLIPAPVPVDSMIGDLIEGLALTSASATALPKG